MGLKHPLLSASILAPMVLDTPPPFKILDPPLAHTPANAVLAGVITLRHVLTWERGSKHSLNWLHGLQAGVHNHWSKLPGIAEGPGQAYRVGCTLSSEVKHVPLQGLYNKLRQATHTPYTSPHYLHNMHTHRIIINLAVITWLNYH